MANDKDGDFGVMLGDADGFRDDANFDLYKKFVMIVIAVSGPTEHCSIFHFPPPPSVRPPPSQT